VGVFVRSDSPHRLVHSVPHLNPHAVAGASRLARLGSGFCVLSTQPPFTLVEGDDDLFGGLLVFVFGIARAGDSLARLAPIAGPVPARSETYSQAKEVSDQATPP
jgi:hypothetical protein